MRKVTLQNGEICENLSFGEVMQINNIVVICRDFCGIPVIETLLRRKCHWWHQIENQKLNRHLVKYEVILGFPSNICFSRKLFGLRQSSSHVKSNCVCSSWAILRICFFHIFDWSPPTIHTRYNEAYVCKWDFIYLWCKFCGQTKDMQILTPIKWLQGFIEKIEEFVGKR